MTDENNLTLSLTCAICLDIASIDDAVETSCCHQLFCLPCIKNVKQCPTCRKTNLQTTPAYFARRIIGGLNVSCPNDGCNVKITRADLANHLSAHCVFKQILCPDPQCKGAKYTKKSFIEHLTNTHEQFLLENFPKLWQKQENTGTVVVFPPDEKISGKNY